MRSSYKDILDFKVFDCTAKEEKITQFKMLMKDPEVQPFFRNYIENIIATSELNILKRLTALEKLLEAVLKFKSILQLDNKYVLC